MTRKLPVADDLTELSRRTFLHAMTLTGAWAASGCESPSRETLPYVSTPPGVVPGVPQVYATSTTRGGYASGLLAQSHAGRPTKLEGNPDHPASLGGTFATEQAAIYQLYDPDRATSARYRGEVSPARKCLQALDERIATGDRIAVLLEPSASPALQYWLDELTRAHPHVELFVEPRSVSAGAMRLTEQQFGAPHEALLDPSRADVIIDFDSNLLVDHPMSAAWSRTLLGRRCESTSGGPRLWVAETAVSPTGMIADARLAVVPSRLGLLGRALIDHVRTRASARFHPTLSDACRGALQQLDAAARNWVTSCGNEWLQAPERTAAFAGSRASTELHAVALALNRAAQSGTEPAAVSYVPSGLLRVPADHYSLPNFARALASGRFGAALILGPNPCYSAPAALGISRLLQQIPLSVHVSLYDNETSAACQYLLPMRHFLECWGDGLAADGTDTVQQPLIKPRFDAYSALQVVAHLAGSTDLREYAVLTRARRVKLSQADWNSALQLGFLRGESPRPMRKLAEPSGLAAALSGAPQVDAGTPLELEFRPAPFIAEGELGNVAWLQELPDPVYKLTWDNALLMSPDDAQRLGAKTGQRIQVTHADASVTLPVLIAPGQAVGAATVWVGYGRTGSESVARGVGVDVATLRDPNEPWKAVGVTVKLSPQFHDLAVTQRTFDEHDRELARTWRVPAQPGAAPVQTQQREPPGFFHSRRKRTEQWAMTIDLGRCTGCSACVVACQAENNIPSVGKAMVLRGREMHWIRIDVYTHPDSASAPIRAVPVPCQHCETAPCEYVCPVNATTHSDDGINEMTYNRCVGTRFCSNNCPYKVRRFNWIDFNADKSAVEQLRSNPQVTVRARGVMEKCTYCVQRIRKAQIDAKLDDRALVDGDVVTACAQACPTGAIVFGSLTDPTAAVTRLRNDARSYSLLAELGTRPRTTYLARPVRA